MDELITKIEERSKKKFEELTYSRVMRLSDQLKFSKDERQQVLDECKKNRFAKQQIKTFVVFDEGSNIRDVCLGKGRPEEDRPKHRIVIDTDGTAQARLNDKKAKMIKFKRPDSLPPVPEYATIEELYKHLSEAAQSVLNLINKDEVVPDEAKKIVRKTVYHQLSLQLFSYACTHKKI